MKTDGELLEAAAKAAGIPIHVWGAKGAESVADMSDPSNHRLWNPLTDDGDALRLAVKLHLHEAIKMAHRLVSGDRDFYAATRLSIVRAAASLQETKQ